MNLIIRLLLCRLLLIVQCVVAKSFDSHESDEAKHPPRPGTLCKLLSREILTTNTNSTTSPSPAVHRLRFSLPLTAQIPDCCNGESGMLHVRVKAPDDDARGVVGGGPTTTMRLQPYSAHIVDDDSSNKRRSFDLLVKIYHHPTIGTTTSSSSSNHHPGVSAYLGAVAINDYVHIPEIRALDWWRDSKRVGLICFGVGVTECLAPANVLLQDGAEVRMVYANRHADDQLLLEELRVLLVEYPGRFRLRHCLSRPTACESRKDSVVPSIEGERTTHGRLDVDVLTEEFGGSWHDGDVIQHFFMVGTEQMEHSVIGMIAQARLFDFSKFRGHPRCLLAKGPYGINSKWTALSPPQEESSAGETTVEL